MPPSYQPPPRKHTARTLILVAFAVLVVGTAALLVISQLGPSPTPYQNGDYQPPPEELDPPAIPQPKTVSEAEDWTQRNPFYDQVVPEPILCENITNEPDAGMWSPEQLHTFLATMTACFMSVWHTPAEAAGYQIYRPTATVYGDRIEYACGDSGINASYCSADQQMYFSHLLMAALGFEDGSSMGVAIIWAHEFGHNLQGRTGILGAEHALERLAGGEETDAGLEMSRRTELQADCLSGMFMRSVARSIGFTDADIPEAESLLLALSDSGPVGNHGQGESRKYWWSLGYGTDKISACNTFVADPELVR